MSEDQEKRIGLSDDEPTGDDVEAHVKGGRGANDEDGSDDVEAHVKGGRSASDDDGDDVEAHVKAR